ncbi:MAG: precorrin-8X methylmutase [Chloroflexaceae bacterium]|nr:precorrin-8X methylmutase [Chloroflexaceae bacterium]
MAMHLREPESIATQSFRIIRQHLDEAGYQFEPSPAAIIERIIHSTADFEFASLTRISDGAIEAGVSALQRGCAIITDVQMVLAGLDGQRLAAFQCSAHCFVRDPQVQARASTEGVTRSAMGMRLAAEQGLLNGGIVAVGNAPTALYEVIALSQRGYAPALIIGVPVGFVGTVEAKTALMELTGVPWIVTTGYKGGSTIAVATVNALLRLASGDTNSTL